MRKMIVFLSVVLALAMILVSCAKPTPPAPAAELVPVPASSEEKTEEPTETPTPLPIIEAEWETNGPYGERPRLSSGIQGLFIDSEDGEVVRAIEYLAVWQTTNGGQSWERLNRDLTKEEMAVFSAQPLSTDCSHTIHGHTTPVWEGWECLAAQFPSLARRFTGAFPSVNPNNSNNVFVAVVIPANFVYPGFPDERPSRLKEFPPHGIITRLFLSLDGGKTYREITAPPSNWTITWRKDAEGKTTYTTEHNLRAGATAIVSYKGNLKLYVGLAQRWYDPSVGEHGGPSIIWQTTLSMASLLD